MGTLPRRDRHGDVCWKRPSIPAVTDILKNPAYAGAFVYGRTRQKPSSRPGGSTDQNTALTYGLEIRGEGQIPSLH